MSIPSPMLLTPECKISLQNLYAYLLFLWDCQRHLDKGVSVSSDLLIS